MKFLQSAAMRRAGLLVTALLLAAACAQQQGEKTAAAPQSTSGGGQVIATYDDKRFTTEDFRRELERLPPRSRAQLTTPERKRQFVDNYILNELLADTGHAQGYDRDPEITRQIDDLRRRLVVQRVMKDLQEPPELSDADVHAYYDQNRRLFSGSQVRAAHILVKDEDLAKRLREELRQDPSKFEELARQNSTDTATAARGGDLGFFGQGRMVPEFEQAAFGLEKPGDISELVKTPFGFHIIKLLERKEGTERPFDEVKDRIRVTLLNQRRQEQTQKRFDELKAKAKVTIKDDVLAATEVPSAAGPGTTPGPGVTPPTPIVEGGH
jgi:peptidyl-prolyl cis-trans isomerase C